MKNLDNLVVEVAKGYFPTISNNQVKRFIREYSESQPTTVLDTCKNIVENEKIQNVFCSSCDSYFLRSDGSSTGI